MILEPVLDRQSVIQRRRMALLGRDLGSTVGSIDAEVLLGRGRALNLLATWFPNSRFVGIDLSQEAIEFACVKRTDPVLHRLVNQNRLVFFF